MYVVCILTAGCGCTMSSVGHRLSSSASLVWFLSTGQVLIGTFYLASVAVEIDADHNRMLLLKLW